MPYQAIPRGGLIVLGILSYVLDLFTCNPPAQLGDTNVLGEPLYSSLWKSDSGESHLSLFEAGAGAFVLSFPETENFSVGADEVVAQPARAAEPRAVEIGFLGVVMSFWLELQGIPTLHARRRTPGSPSLHYPTSPKEWPDSPASLSSWPRRPCSAEISSPSPAGSEK